MPTYLMLGRYSMEALEAISAVRSNQARALISENGGRVRGEYALLGDKDLAILVDLPDNERAIKIGVELGRLLRVSFSTLPAVTVDEFDRLVG